MNICIREIRPDELPRLKDMLYEAIYQPDENNLVPRDVIHVPEVRVYIEGFGTAGADYCLVADLEGRIVGAVWTRILSGEIKGYGNIDDKTPEFAISLFKEFRGKGIGMRLMTAMLGYLKGKGYEQASLNVKKDNYAVRLYKKTGFRIIDENEEDYLMLVKLV